MVQLLLEDDDGVVFAIPDSFQVDISPFSYNNSYQHLVDNPGAINIGDGQPRERTISISGWLHYDTIEELRDIDRELQKALSKSGKLYWSDLPDQYLYVIPDDYQSELGEVRTLKEFKLTYTAIIPFWQNVTLDEQEEIVTGSDTFDVDFSDSAWFYRPQIKIESNKGASLPSITMENTTTGESWTYTNAGFTTGKTLIIDGKLGIVTLDWVDSHINMVIPWSHIRLFNKVNSFSYTGNACTITISSRKYYR